MANFTVKDAISIRGTDPQLLFEKIVRSRIHDSMYWKESCFALTASEIAEKSVLDIKYIGGCFGGNEKPTEFICLLLKMLQIQPEKGIIYEFINQDDFKYLRVLGAFYLRLVGTPAEIYEHLEDLLTDYRKIRMRNRDGSFSLTYVDQVIDSLLNEERYCSTTLPRITKRSVLEDKGELSPRISPLDPDADSDSDSDSGSNGGSNSDNDSD